MHIIVILTFTHAITHTHTLEVERDEQVTFASTTTYDAIITMYILVN